MNARQDRKEGPNDGFPDVESRSLELSFSNVLSGTLASSLDAGTTLMGMVIEIEVASQRTDWTYQTILQRPSASWSELIRRRFELSERDGYGEFELCAKRESESACSQIAGPQGTCRPILASTNKMPQSNP